MSSTVAGNGLTPSEEYTVLVAVNNPGNAEQLVRTAVDLAVANDGRVHVVSVIHKHHTSPFLLFEDEYIKSEFSGDRQRLVDRATSVAEEAGVPVADSLLVGSSVSGVLLDAIDEVDANAILLGWRGGSTASDRVLGTTIDPVVRRARCDVLVERVGLTTSTVGTILLPTVGGPHAELATEVTGAIAARNDATVDVLSVIKPGADDRERDTATGHIERSLELLPPEVETDRLVIESDDIAGTILDVGEDHDVIVLGATRQGVLTRRVAGSIPRTVGAETDRPFVMTKRRPDRSRLGELITRWWP
ncbi:universal stress protein [Natranaeroarchaeum aerophilus]|uniref:Universal stress protein n=1 Tax=Natranaeroarchaeum aerophilus TaxID=2917711 RepID=A0AAE3K666_9EURY|nr:universal stress protein [Natranaeroarchaeum aerophilus]MCL9812489.1 universal stress protein [Natranaeroarchaeum aerophilus]